MKKLPMYALKISNCMSSSYGFGTLYQPSNSDEIDKEPRYKQVRFAPPHPVQGRSIRNQQNEDMRI